MTMSTLKRGEVEIIFAMGAYVGMVPFFGTYSLNISILSILVKSTLYKHILSIQNSPILLRHLHNLNLTLSKLGLSSVNNF